MDNIVTFQQLLNIEDTILANAKSREIYNEALKEYVTDQYDYLMFRKKFINLFAQFKSNRYLYDFPVEENVKITSCYEEKIGFTQRSNVSQVEKAVTRHLDKLLLTTDIYNAIMKVSFKLTGWEAIYLNNTFFPLKPKSEEKIADLIGISKTYLQRYKKSCLVKMWVELEKYCEKDD